MNLLLPLLIPLASAALMVAVGRHAAVHRWLAVAGSLGQLAASLVLAVQVGQSGPASARLGGWPAPYGIVFVADTFSAMMAAAAAFLGLLAVLSCLTSIEQGIQKLHFFPVLMALLAGVAGAFLTGDLFNLYVWFEVILMSSFVLMSLGRGPRQTPAALRYVALNLVGSSFFLAACGLIYGAAGSLNMADLAGRIGQVQPGLATALGCLLLCAFLIKAASFPLFGWLPSSYPSVPASVGALMAGLLTKVGVYAVYRIFTLVYHGHEGLLGWVLAFAALTSMLAGGIAAYGQDECRRILTFSIISHIGMMLGAAAIGTKEALAAGIFLIFVNMFSKAGLFYLSGAAEDEFPGAGIREMGGLREIQPWASRIFLILALSLAGAPPLAGFFGKAALLTAFFQVQSWAMAAVLLASSLLGLLAMMRLWLEAYAKPLPKPRPRREARLHWLGPAGALAAALAVMAVLAGPLHEACLKAGGELVQPSGYIEASLGGRTP